MYGIGYHAYLNCLKVDTVKAMDEDERLSQKKRISAGYYSRVAKLQGIWSQFSAPGRAGSCKAVWREHVYPVYGISYTTFKKYLNEEIPADIDLTATE